MAAIPPCPASWSLTMPCQNPAGDLHPDPCFHVHPDGERETWDRNVSYSCEPVRIWDRAAERLRRYGV